MFLLRTIVTLLVIYVTTARVITDDPKTIANRVLDTVPLIDGHNDWPINMKRLVDNQLSLVDFRQNLTNDPIWGIGNCEKCHTDIPRLQAGKVGAQFWSAYTVCDSQYRDATEKTLEQIDVIQRLVNVYPDVFEFVTSAKGIENAFAAGRIGSMIGVEGGHNIDGRLGILRLYYKMGVRYMTLTHKCTTPWADSSTADDPGQIAVHNGLSDFGKVVLDEMNRLGMLIDLSHVSKDTQLDALSVTKAPVIFSHSSAFAVCNHTRNVHDDVLLRVKANNGIVMVNFYTLYTACSSTGGTIQDVANHINHIRRVAGVDHVGIGADYDGVTKLPDGLEDVSGFPRLFEFLAADTNEPWTENELQKLAGLNLLRVFREVERVRDEMAVAGAQPREDIIPPEFIGNNTYCMSPP